MDWNNHKPPWICFPNHPGFTVLRATQGAEETWLSEHWWPFWLSLNPSERADYLHHWNASSNWIDSLQYFTDLYENFDHSAMAADAVNSESYSAELAAKNWIKPWYDRFIFWRK